ncbi:MAG: hypothetical protein PHI97_12280 [Desulfobulbus sp.]|nr:hypothetical protein [Desulfobulbus sp.]
MKYYFSGFYEQDALAQGYTLVDKAATIWLEPDTFVDRCQEDDKGQPDQRLIWLYRAPWSLVSSCPDFSGERFPELCQQWANWQRTLLSLRHRPISNLLLINRDSTSAQDLIDSFGLSKPSVNAASPVQDQTLTTILGKFFEWLDPSLWDIVEALEATAYIPKGEAIFRNSLAPPTPDGMQALLHLIQAGRVLPKTVEELAGLTETVQQLIAEKESLLCTMKEAQTQLQQAKKNSANERQQLENRLAALQQEMVLFKDDSKQSSQSLQEENELLLLQLHQVQQELEKLFLENRDSSAKLKEENKKLTDKVAQIKAELTKTSHEIAVLKKSSADLSANEKKLTVELKAAQQANDTLLTEKKELLAQKKATEEKLAHELRGLQEENELLLLQLHQVQEELENYFLCNQQMRASLSRSQQTMDRARILLSRLAYHSNHTFSM